MKKEKPITLTPALMKRWPLPDPDQDKEGRGRVLVIGGASELPGAAILAGIGALRAGAGKLQIAVSEKVAPLLAVQVPEALVVGIPETSHGGMSKEGRSRITDLASDAQAVLVGPGLTDTDYTLRLIEALLPVVREGTLIMDAEALKGFRKNRAFVSRLDGRVIVTPHHGEMANILETPKTKVEGEALEIARRFARETGAVTALKGLETHIVAPGGQSYFNPRGHSGLGTSGSGDVLAGVIAGLVARGAKPLQAAAWGVFLHARAGRSLGRSIGATGYLAREILSEIAREMHLLSRTHS